MAPGRIDDISSGGCEPSSAWPEAQGRAALLLVESLLHSLVEKGLLSTQDGMSVVEGAHEIAVEFSRSMSAMGDMDETVRILERLVDSLHRDLKG
jgi:hypothetical protein